MKLLKYSILVMFLASGAALAEEGSTKSIEMNQKLRANQESMWGSVTKITNQGDQGDQALNEDEAKLMDKSS